MYQSIQNQSYSPFQCKILNIQQTNSKRFLLVIQVSGKNSIFKAFPEDIVDRDNFITCFSQIDVRTITRLATENANSNGSLKIISQYIDKKTAKDVSVFEKEDGTILALYSVDVACDNNLIRKLSPEDAKRIGFIAGVEITRTNIERIKNQE